MDIGGWLRKLGLEQYEPAFRENDVDAEVLAELTVDDLISIGVTSVGHRRKRGHSSRVLRRRTSRRTPRGSRRCPAGTGR